MSLKMVFTILLLNYSVFLFADETLDTIEVTTDKEFSKFTFGSHDVVSDYELETTTDSTLTSSLKKIPGVYMVQDGGPGGRTTFFIRGTESRHVSFTLDGLKLNDPSNIDRQFDSAFFTSPHLKVIQLHKGPQAVLLGSDAIGGLFDLQTRKGEGAPETRLMLNAGSFGTADASLSSDWKKKNHQGTVTWNSMRTDGLSRLNKKRFDASERDGADITQITSSSRHQWQENWQSDFLASFLRGQNELDGFTDDNSHDKSRNDQYILQQKTQKKIDSRSAISIRNGFNRHQRDYDQLAFGKNSYQGELLQNELLYKTESNDFSTLSGLATDHESLKSTGIQKSFELHSLFLQTLTRKGNWALQAGGRADQHSRYGFFPTGSTGLLHQHLNLKNSLQYSQGFKSPTLYQLYDPLFGNKNLNPETNHSWEWKTEYGDKKGLTSLALFQNRLSNIVNWSNGRYQNQGSFIAEGFELGVQKTVHDFEMRSSFTHQNFRREETPVLRRPMNMASLEASYFFQDKAEAYINGRWFDERKDFNENGQVVKLVGYETFDVGFKWFQGKSDYGIQIVNITNRLYEMTYGYSVMPRSLFLHYGLKF